MFCFLTMIQISLALIHSGDANPNTEVQAVERERSPLFNMQERVKALIAKTENQVISPEEDPSIDVLRQKNLTFLKKKLDDIATGKIENIIVDPDLDHHGNLKEIKEPTLIGWSILEHRHSTDNYPYYPPMKFLKFPDANRPKISPESEARNDLELIKEKLDEEPILKYHYEALMEQRKTLDKHNFVKLFPYPFENIDDIIKRKTREFHKRFPNAKLKKSDEIVINEELQTDELIKNRELKSDEIVKNEESITDELISNPIDIKKTSEDGAADREEIETSIVDIQEMNEAQYPEQQTVSFQRSLNLLLTRSIIIIRKSIKSLKRRYSSSNSSEGEEETEESIREQRKNELLIGISALILIIFLFLAILSIRRANRSRSGVDMGKIREQFALNRQNRKMGYYDYPY